MDSLTTRLDVFVIVCCLALLGWLAWFQVTGKLWWARVQHDALARRVDWLETDLVFIERHLGVKPSSEIRADLAHRREAGHGR